MTVFAGTRPNPEATVARCLERNLVGMAIGNRLSVPFRADLISIMIGKQHSMVGGPDIITDFSPNDKAVTVVAHDDRMDIYFHEYPSLQKELGRWEGMLVITYCELTDDLFDPANHKRLACKFRTDDMRVRFSLDGMIS